MTYTYIQLTPLLRGWHTIVLSGACGLVLAILLSLLSPLNYSASTSVLITQQLSGVDAYTAIRSAEGIASNLSGVIYTSDFFTKVMDSGTNIDKSYFPADELDLRKLWEKTVTASVSQSSGILEITAYHPNPAQAKEIAAAVANVFVNQGYTYISGSDVSIKVVDNPLASRYPVRPNLPINGLSGLFLGLIGGAAYVYIVADRQKRRHSMMHLTEEV